MTDVVEMLREGARQIVIDGTPAQVGPGATVLVVAADEIDRLRAEVKKYKAKEAAIIRLWNDPDCQ